MTALIVEGMTAKEVCLKYGITQTWLSLIRKSLVWRDEERALADEFRQAGIVKSEVEESESRIVHIDMIGSGGVGVKK